MVIPKDKLECAPDDGTIAANSASMVWDSLPQVGKADVCLVFQSQRCENICKAFLGCCGCSEPTYLRDLEGIQGGCLHYNAL